MYGLIWSRIKKLLQGGKIYYKEYYKESEFSPNINAPFVSTCLQIGAKCIDFLADLCGTLRYCIDGLIHLDLDLLKKLGPCRDTPYSHFHLFVAV